MTPPNVVANASIDGTNKTVTLTYTDYPQTHSDVSGSFFFYVRVDRSQMDEERDIPLIYEINGETLIGDTIHFEGFPNPTPRLLGKSGEQASSGDRRSLRYQLNINTKKEEMKNVNVTDEMESPGITFDKESLRIYKGNWQIVKGDWWLIDQEEVTEDYEVEWGEDGNTFSIDFGDIAENEGFQVKYTANSSYDFVDGEQIKNKATITGSNIESVPVYGVATYYMAGGAAEGYVYEIKIHKEDNEGNALAGAEFDVIRISNSQKVGTLTTGVTGEASIGGLLKDGYLIVETSAPEGYSMSEDPIEVDVSDFGEDKTAVVTITNLPLATEPTTESAEEPTMEPTTEPTEEPTTEPSTESTEKPTTEPTTESAEEPTTEPTTESAEEPTTEPTTESAEEPTTEPTTEPTEESTTEPTTEPTEEPTTEPTTESAEEPTTEPTTEYTEPTTETTEETTVSTELTTEFTEETDTGHTDTSEIESVSSEQAEKTKAPKTGDSGKIFWYVFIGLLSIDVIVILFIAKKIKN